MKSELATYTVKFLQALNVMQCTKIHTLDIPFKTSKNAADLLTFGCLPSLAATWLKSLSHFLPEITFTFSA